MQFMQLNRNDVFCTVRDEFQRAFTDKCTLVQTNIYMAHVHVCAYQLSMLELQL